MLKKIKSLDKIPREKLTKIIVIAGIIAVLGIFLSESFASSKKEEKAKTPSVSTDRSEYETEIEDRLQNILSEIDGIGECKVMVTLESSSQNVYSSDRETSADEGEKDSSFSESSKYVVLDDDGEKALLEKEIEPRVRGVIVVCGGADNVVVKQSVIDCVSAGLGISSANISVVRGGNNE